MSNNFDFTIAVSPDSLLRLEKEMKYIKTALLYADTITLISPVAHTFFELTDKKYIKNERSGLILLDKVAPLIKSCDPQFYKEYEKSINPIKEIINSNTYKKLPPVIRLQLKEALIQLSEGIDMALRNAIGNGICNDLSYLVNNNIIKLETFQTTFDDADEYVIEYFNKLGHSISNSYALFDEESNNLMSAAISEGIINVNETAKYKATHAGLADSLLLKLPSFEFAEVDEILDIRKELEKPLLRFRGKTLQYTDNIQSLPWDEGFEDECLGLYNKEIVPSILEIREMIEDNNIMKNLGVKILTNESILNNVGGLLINIAAAGVITSLNNTIAFDKAILTAGGAWAVSKVANAYNEYRNKEKDAERKDLFFYYKAGRNLIDEKYKM